MKGSMASSRRGGGTKGSWAFPLFSRELRTLWGVYQQARMVCGISHMQIATSRSWGGRRDGGWGRWQCRLGPLIHCWGTSTVCSLIWGGKGGGGVLAFFSLGKTGVFFFFLFLLLCTHGAAKQLRMGKGGRGPCGLCISAWWNSGEQGSCGQALWTVGLGSNEGWRDTENPPKMVGDYSSTEVACDEEEVLQGF